MSDGQIDGERVLLRPIERDVARLLLEGATPTGIAFAEGWPSVFSLEVMDLIAGPRATTQAGFRPWFVVRRDDDAVIGEIGYSLDAGSATATLGYALIEPCWGRGYATEALRALIGQLRVDPGVRRLTAQTPVEHLSSRRVLEKAGMRLAEQRIGDVDGELVELAVYEA